MRVVQAKKSQILADVGEPTLANKLCQNNSCMRQIQKHVVQNAIAALGYGWSNNYDGTTLLRVLVQNAVQTLNIAGIGVRYDELVENDPKH